MNYFIVIYLLIISIISGIIFYSDKRNALKNLRRVPEKTLHLLELAGGVFANLILMYTIRHKNQKKSYFLYTYLILLLWLVLIFLYVAYF